MFFILFTFALKKIKSEIAHLTQFVLHNCLGQEPIRKMFLRHSASTLMPSMASLIPISLNIFRLRISKARASPSVMDGSS
jgi:hypothetical protein